MPHPDLAGAVPGNGIYHCGAHSNLRLSAEDLGAFMAFVRYDETVFSAANRALMDELRLGWSASSNTPDSGRLGKFWHGGDMYVGSGREFHSCVMKYPQNVEATLVVNSDIDGKNQCTVLKDAFNVALPQRRTRLPDAPGAMAPGGEHDERGAMFVHG